MTYEKSKTSKEIRQKIALNSTFEEVRLVYRNRTPAAYRTKIKSPKDAFDVLVKNWDNDQIGLLEECKVLLLDRSLRLMSIASISKGGMSGTIIDPKVVFSIALKRRANSIILAHNHPSGNLKPSDPDIRLTENFIMAGKVLQIPLEDHLIITQDGYTSLLADGYVG